MQYKKKKIGTKIHLIARIANKKTEMYPLKIILFSF